MKNCKGKQGGDYVGVKGNLACMFQIHLQLNHQKLFCNQFGSQGTLEASFRL